MLAYLLRVPHNLYRRYQAFIESTLTILGLALILTLTLNNLRAYPYNWVLVIGVGVAVIGLRYPGVAFAISVAALVYPIYQINLYLGVLFLAAGVLGQRFCVHHLGMTILVLATPSLAEYHLHWLTPILAGLWWGGGVGLWAGVLAALWGKFLGGMAGMDIDWLTLAGQPLTIDVIRERFANTNSLETLRLLVEPFAGDPNFILYHLLQVIGWAVAGGFVGVVATQSWIKYRTPWSVLVVTAGGGLILLGTQLGLPYWLTDVISDEGIAVVENPTGLLFSLLVVIIVGTLVYTIRESLDLPVAPQRWMPRKRTGFQPAFKGTPLKFFQGKSTTPAVTNPEPMQRRQPVRVPHQSELPEWEPPTDDKGLIMLEID